VHPRNAQALARHSTIDLPPPRLRQAGLTRNVYTHVAMGDLHEDVEALPTVAVGGAAEPAAVAATGPGSGDASDGLAGLVAFWHRLPEKVRAVIASLAEV